MPARPIPAPGTAELPAPNAAALLRRNGTDAATADRPAVCFEDRIITHAEFLAESLRWANLFLAQPPSTPDGIRHVGVLLDNVPEYLFALAGAALSGSVIVGLNHTRRDEHLWRDFVDAGMPAADGERVAGVIQRMRPRAQAAADAALAEAMEKYTDTVFTQTAERLASKSRQRRKPSAS